MGQSKTGQSAATQASRISSAATPGSQRRKRHASKLTSGASSSTTSTSVRYSAVLGASIAASSRRISRAMRAARMPAPIGSHESTCTATAAESAATRRQRVSATKPPVPATAYVAARVHAGQSKTGHSAATHASRISSAATPGSQRRKRHASNVMSGASSSTISTSVRYSAVPGASIAASQRRASRAMRAARMPAATGSHESACTASAAESPATRRQRVSATKPPAPATA